MRDIFFSKYREELIFKELLLLISLLCKLNKVLFSKKILGPFFRYIDAKILPCVVVVHTIGFKSVLSFFVCGSLFVFCSLTLIHSVISVQDR